MKRVGLLALLAMTLQACANNSGSAPSYLGVSAEAYESDDDVAPVKDPTEHPELRHVASNKVLGAMAFHKTTGRTVDPSRLLGRQ